uniref:Uncharacterized protein n=1 Tax=Physcomitrium patens TaxID=3218 RepID=A0A2K1KVY1_PHYPA|nr:hypothetical protein PHYPA_004938 [Physcomitrium patens]
MLLGATKQHTLLLRRRRVVCVCSVVSNRVCSVRMREHTLHHHHHHHLHALCARRQLLFPGRWTRSHPTNELVSHS